MRGDYSLLMAIESSSRPNSWYRVLTDRQSGVLSCDCPPWTFNQQHDVQGRRSCPHTTIASRLITTGQTVAPPTGQVAPAASLSPLLTATQTQWPGLQGIWSIEERDAQIGPKPYHFVLLRLALGNGGTASGVVAFAHSHHHTETEMVAGVAGWAGYAIAAEVARLGGFPMAGQPPEHFRIDRRPTTGRRTRPEQPAPAVRPTPAVPSIGLADILRVGDIVQPGRDPRVVAEQTLALFLGEELYAKLEQQGFLDVSSVRYGHEQRVYRLRRDRHKERERRVRVFEQASYTADYCIVRNQAVPEADFWLTNWLMFLSDEMIALSVVRAHNIFLPYSDGDERETIPAVWVPRVA